MSSPIKPQAHFTAFLAGVGYHESAWRLADPGALADPYGALERATRIAERGLLDAAFFADSPGLEIFRARYFPQVGQIDTMAPQQPDGGDQPGERDHHDQASHRHLSGPLRPGLD